MRKYNKRTYADNEVTRRIYEKYDTVKAFVSCSGISMSTVRSSILLSEKVPNGLTVLMIAESLDLPFDTVADCVGFEKTKLVREIYKTGKTISDFAYDVNLRAQTVYDVCYCPEKRHIYRTIVRIAKGLGKTYDEIIEMLDAQQ